MAEPKATGVKINFPADLRSSETADLFMSLIMYRLNEHGRAAVIIPDGFLFGTDNAKAAIKKKLLEEFNLHTIIRLPSSVFSPYTLDHDQCSILRQVQDDGKRLVLSCGYASRIQALLKTKSMKVEHFDDCVAWWNDRKAIKDAETDTYKSKSYSIQELVSRGYDLDLCGYPTAEEEVFSPEETIQLFHEKRDALNAKIDKRLARIEALLGALK